MQDTIEVIRVTKNPDTCIIDRVRKLIEWRDVISIEEGGQEIAQELEEDNLLLVTLSYGEIVVKGSYSILKKKWLMFREDAKEADGKVRNILN